MSKTKFPTPSAAEEAFYRAFESSDLDAMMDIWLDADYVECIHPMGHRVVGHTAIRESWQGIFQSPMTIKFEMTDKRTIAHSSLAIHLVNETLTLDEGKKQVQVLATNIYEKTPQGWYMILHHASPGPTNQVKKTARHKPTVH